MKSSQKLALEEVKSKVKVQGNVIGILKKKKKKNIQCQTMCMLETKRAKIC